MQPLCAELYITSLCFHRSYVSGTSGMTSGRKVGGSGSGVFWGWGRCPDSFGPGLRGFPSTPFTPIHTT